MGDLTKQQLITLVFLVSFVTALFTGIVTVSLVQQAPASITQTIQKVIERSASVEPNVPPLEKQEAKELEIGALSRDILVGDIVGRTSPAVASVIATKYVPIIEKYFINPFSNDDFLGDLFSDIQIPQFRENGTEKRQISSGTGFFVTADGFLITNKHVVADKSVEYSIIMNDGKTFEAKVIARDPLYDVAILKIEGKDFSFIPLGDSDSAKVGHTAIAIGNTLGEFQNTVSIGIISGLKRNIVASGGGIVEELTDLIQTDAAINPGNSGGPLLNLKGEAIGLNAAVAQGAENVGFALPINQIKKGFSDAQKFGKIIYPFFGVRYEMVDGGAKITKSASGEEAIVFDSPAQKAGLKEGDIIKKFGEKNVTKDTPLAKLIQERRAGETITIIILRDTTEMTLQATLGERKE